MEFLANLLSGGVLGAVSSIFNGWLKHIDEKDRRKFQLEMIKANSDAAVREIEARVKIQKEITEGNVRSEEMAAERAEMNGRNQLVERLTGRYFGDDILMKMLNDDSIIGKIFRPVIFFHVLFMDAIRGVIRPLVTSGSILFSFYVFVEAFGLYQKLGGNLDPSELMDNVIRPTIDLLIFTVSVVVGFWFADKSAARRFQIGVKK